MIRAVLFDADGVVQSAAIDWKTSFAHLLESTDKLDEFMAEVFAAEGPALIGGADFQEDLAVVLRRWRSIVPAEEALALWASIDVASDLLVLVREVRDLGIGTYLATNQNAHRARFMSEALGYDEVFDKQFYSCDLGVKKPDAGFFEAVLADIDQEPSSVLFIDDSEANVEAARHLGLHASTFERFAGPKALRTILDGFGISLRAVNEL